MSLVKDSIVARKGVGELKSWAQKGVELDQSRMRGVSTTHQLFHPMASDNALKQGDVPDPHDPGSST